VKEADRSDPGFRVTVSELKHRATLAALRVHFAAEVGYLPGQRPPARIARDAFWRTPGRMPGRSPGRLADRRL
jgi:hypothetical protein